MSGMADAMAERHLASYKSSSCYIDFDKRKIVGELEGKMDEANQKIVNAATEAIKGLERQPTQRGRGTQGALTDIGRTAITNINEQVESKKREIGNVYQKACNCVQGCESRVRMEEKAKPVLEEMKKLANEGVEEIKKFLKAPADEACDNLDKIRDPDQELVFEMREMGPLKSILENAKESSQTATTRPNSNTNTGSLRSDGTVEL